jgi:hypothetical protein
VQIFPHPDVGLLHLDGPAHITKVLMSFRDSHAYLHCKPQEPASPVLEKQQGNNKKRELVGGISLKVPELRDYNCT